MLTQTICTKARLHAAVVPQQLLCGRAKPTSTAWDMGGGAGLCHHKQSSCCSLSHVSATISDFANKQQMLQLLLLGATVSHTASHVLIQQLLY